MAAKPNELEIVRVYDAPVKLVWEAFTDVKHQAHWWGPRGFTITTKSKDLRPGGKWIYTMHGPDGVDWPNITTYHEVVPYERLVYDHGGNEDRPKLFTVTVTFREELGKTLMVMIMALDTPEAAKEIKKFIKQAGGNSTWDRLAEYLDHETTGKDPFVINRTFEAPQAKVFEMWTDVKHLSRWMPPQGFNMEVINGEIKTGKSMFYSMSNGEFAFFGKSHYQDINPVTRIIYTQEFADKDGKPAKHPGAPTWPSQMINTVEFVTEGPNLTRVTMKTEVLGEATAEERKAFHDEKAGMTVGWNGSFDRLDELL